MIRSSSCKFNNKKKKTNEKCRGENHILVERNAIIYIPNEVLGELVVLKMRSISNNIFIF